MDSLTLPGDPGFVTRVHPDEQTAFGALIVTKRSIPPRIGPDDSPMGVDLEQVGNRVFRNPASLAREHRRLNRLLPAPDAMLPIADRLSLGVV